MDVPIDLIIALVVLIVMWGYESYRVNSEVGMMPLLRQGTYLSLACVAAELPVAFIVNPRRATLMIVIMAVPIILLVAMTIIRVMALIVTVALHGDPDPDGTYVSAWVVGKYCLMIAAMDVVTWFVLHRATSG